MNILLTNDDGIQAAGLAALAEAALERGHHVLISAPKTQQSAASHRITLGMPLMVDEINWDGASAYAVHGSPADCVRIGRQLAQKPIDFALSGINNGWNAGVAVLYSGTFSAAREARMCGFPAMAVSIAEHAVPPALKRSAAEAIRLMEELKDKKLSRLSVWNVNFPGIAPDSWKPMKSAPLSEAFFLDQYEQRISPRGQRYFWLQEGLHMEPAEPDTDLALLQENHPVLSLVGGYRNEQCPNFEGE